MNSKELAKYIRAFEDKEFTLRLQNTRGKHNKFYQINVTRISATNRWLIEYSWGRIGYTSKRNQRSTQTTSSWMFASSQAHKKAVEKIGRGYDIVPADSSKVPVSVKQETSVEDQQARAVGRFSRIVPR